MSWETALNAVADHFKAIMQAGQGHEVGGLISGSASCEELFCFRNCCVVSVIPCRLPSTHE